MYSYHYENKNEGKSFVGLSMVRPRFQKSYDVWCVKRKYKQVAG